jgi:hypothetical protein
MTKPRKSRLYTVKEFVLSDGTTLTAREVADKYDVPLSTTRTRLSNGVRDTEALSKSPLHHKRTRLGVPPPGREASVKELIAKRNFNCPLSRLFLKMTH